MSKKAMSKLVILGAVLIAPSFAPSPAPAQEREHHGLTIVAPANGATVSGPLTVAFGFGGGGANREHQGHGGGPHVFLLVDQPAPEPGATIQTDPTHIAFPEGQTQIIVTLPPGKHTLQLAVIDREGKVARRFHGAEAVTVIVQ